MTGSLAISFLLFFSAGCTSRQAIKTKTPANESQTAKADSNSPSSGGKCVYGCADKGTTSPTDKKLTPTVASPSTAAPASSSVAQKASEERDYILGPEDVIEVQVWKNESLSKTVTIRPDGKISLPLIGDVEAAGISANLLRDNIKEKLKQYKETPEVAVIVKEINSMMVFVTGEVAHPGKIMLRSETTLLQAITMAGGFTQYASSNNITLLRRIDGVETRRVVRYKDIVSGKNPLSDLVLQRGDTIVVP